MSIRWSSLRMKYSRHRQYGEEALTDAEISALFEMSRDLESALCRRNKIPRVGWMALSIRHDRHLIKGEPALTVREIEDLFDFLEKLADQLVES